MKKLFSNTAFYLILAIVVGSFTGFGIRHLPTDILDSLCKALIVVKMLSSQAIFFMVPILILGCVAPSIAKLNGNASKMLVFSLLVAYLSSVASAFFSLGISHLIVPFLKFGTQEQVVALPENPLSHFVIPTIHSMVALIIAIAVGLRIAWSRFESLVRTMEKLQEIILSLLRKIMRLLLPLFIGSNFALLSYTGQISNMGVFLPIIAMIVLCQLLWIVIVFAAATSYSGKNGWQVLRQYSQAYFTALGSMSSIATLPVSLECMDKSKIIEKGTYTFTLPLFSNSNLCGSVIAEMALVTTTYYVFYNAFPPMLNTAIFAVVACILSVGSPGIPGGLNVACSTILGAFILDGGEIDTFMGVMTALYTLQDGFGTACNVVTAGALTLVAEKKNSKASQTEITSIIPMVNCN